jgi:predicted nucleic acid-binding protein
MPTTVEVKRNTARMLEELKKKHHSKSMDETLRRLVIRAGNIPDSMFGSHPKMKPLGVGTREHSMSYEYVIDSYSWIEYFRGTESGKQVRPYVESDSAATSALTLAELKEKYVREKWATFEEDLACIMARTVVTPVDRPIAILAGEINHKRKRTKTDWGMEDSIVLATAGAASAKVVTGDPHFEGLPDALLI